MNIDWNFIAGLEGGRKLEGYVPGSGNSAGVTIATGYDLGQHNDRDLQRYGVSQQLREKLAEYLGKRGPEARRLITERPLTVTFLEAEELDRAAKLEIFENVRRRYDQEVNGKSGTVRFDNLPSEVQTVIASVAYQYGPNLSTASPQIWRQVTSNDWWETYTALMNDTGGYPSRRRQEGAYLRRWLDRQPRTGR